MKFLTGFVFLLLLFSSCMRLDKALEITTKTETNAKLSQQALNSKHPKVVAQNAAVLFPIKERTVTVRDTIRQEVKVPGPVIECPPVTDPKTGKVTVPTVRCPDVTYYATLVTEQKETIQENTAAAEASRLQAEEWKGKYQQEVKDHSDTKAKLADKARKLRIAYIVAIVCGLIVISWIVLKALGRI